MKNKTAPPLMTLWHCILWVGIPGGLLLTFQLLKHQRQLMNFITRKITSPFKYGISYLCSFVPFGVAELIWLAAILGITAFLIRSVILIVRGPRRWARLLRRLLATVAIALWIYTGYTLLWGINYYADTFCDQIGLIDRGCSTQELYALTVAYAEEASRLAELVPRNSDGLYDSDLSSDFIQSVDIYDTSLENFTCLEGPVRQPKPMIFSRIMSYLTFTGFYFPFTGESLINVDQPEFLIPATMLHELSHQRNIAPEDECNFLAILAGTRSSNPDFAYSSCMLAYIHLSNALYKADPELCHQAAAHLSAAAAADNSYNTAYWAQYETPAKTVGDTTYSYFIQSYGQSDGLATYEKCVDLLVAYYFDYAPEEQFWN